MEGQSQEELFAVVEAPEQLGIILEPSQDLFARESHLGSVPRRKAHQLGIWHRVIGVWLYTQSGMLLLQQRSAYKDTNPLKWATSVAGHISYGSSVIEAVLSEVHEEVGVELMESDLEFIGVFAGIETGETEKYGKFVDKEYMFVYAAQVPEDLSIFTPDPSEVQQVKFFPAMEALDRFANEDPTCTHFTKEHMSVVQDWFRTRFP